MAESVRASRVVLTGASNMTRGFAVLCELLRRTLGDPLDIRAAIGHGRSYGRRSSVLGRGLSGVRECGLWPALEEAPPEPTLAIIGDVGNDVLYGAEVDEILAWVDECLERLRRLRARILLTSLPPPVLQLSSARFHVFRTIFFPARHLRYDDMRRKVPHLEDRLRELARTRGATFVPLRPEWYGFDPIHIRPGCCRAAWADVLSAAVSAVPPPRVGLRALSVYRLLPERQWLFGREVRRPQPCRRLSGGTTISLY